MSPRPVESANAAFLRLQAEARHSRERYQLYKARTFGPRPTSSSRLRELKRICESAESRLRRAITSQKAEDLNTKPGRTTDG